MNKKERFDAVRQRQAPDYMPVQPRVQKLMAQYDVTKTDPRMAGCLEVIKNVSAAIGDQMPLVPMYYVGTTAAMFLFRPNEAFNETLEVFSSEL